MDFENLLAQWANEQGFQTWSQDHAAVLRNLTSWLNQHAAQPGVQPTATKPRKYHLTHHDDEIAKSGAV